MSPNDADGMANSVDPDQTAVWSGSTLFAQAYLSENIGSLRYPDQTGSSLSEYLTSLLLYCCPSECCKNSKHSDTQKIAIIILKLEQDNFTTKLWAQKMWNEWQTV